MPLFAAICSPLQGSSCKYASLLTLGSVSQAEGRRFEPGLALQDSEAPSRCYAMGFFLEGLNSPLGQPLDSHPVHSRGHDGFHAPNTTASSRSIALSTLPGIESA